MLIIWILVLIIAVIIGIWSLIYIFIKKGFYTNFNKSKKNPNFEKNIFKYENIIQALGGLENIDFIEERAGKCYFQVFSKSLMDEKWIKRLGIKLSEEESFLVMSLKNYSFSTFVLKTNRLLKSIDK